MKYILCGMLIFLVVMEVNKISRKVFDIGYCMKALTLPLSADVKAYNVRSMRQNVKQLVSIIIDILLAIMIIFVVASCL